jgi:hypothetical protein
MEAKMKETDRLKTMLFPQGKGQVPILHNLKFFPGDDVRSTAEFRDEVHKALLLVDKGMCVRRSKFGEERSQVEIDNFLSIA